MKNKYFCYIFIVVILLFAASILASADESFYVNDAHSALSARLDQVYVIGGGGVDLLRTEKVYALTGKGMQQLGDTAAMGTGHLDDGSPVEINSDRVRVGLAYRYSSTRDSSVPSAKLEIIDGTGFSIGYYDEYEDFRLLESVEEGTLVVRPGPDCAVDIFSQDQDELRFSYESTSKDRYLIVRPEPFDGQTLIRYAGTTYGGEFCFAVLADDRLTVVNFIDLEQYVMGVCAIEMTESWPIEALKAQAVAARTVAQRMIGSSVYYYTCGFDLTADTYSQAYRGTRGVGETIREAVYETRNQYLTYHDELIDAVYSSADGGATEDGENVFGFPNEYLHGVLDPYEESASDENPNSSWKVTMTPAQLGKKVGLGAVQSVTATTSRTGNVIKLELRDAAGHSATLIRDNCRTKLNLKNIRYEISQDDSGNYVFEGSGFGHNAGMSQWGAYAMAKYYAKDYRFILGYYYSDVALAEGELPPKPERPQTEETESFPEAPDNDSPDVGETAHE